MILWNFDLEIVQFLSRHAVGYHEC